MLLYLATCGVLLSLAVLTWPGWTDTTDATARYRTAISIVERQSFAVELPEDEVLVDGWYRPGVDGRPYANYPILHSLLMVPLLLVEPTERAASLVNLLLLPVFVWLLVSLLRKAQFTVRSCYRAVVIIFVSTMIWPYAISSHHNFLQVLLALGIIRFLLVKDRGSEAGSALAGFLFGAMLNVKIAALALGPAVLFLLPAPTVEGRVSPRELVGHWLRLIFTRKTLIRATAFALGAAPMVALYVWSNNIRFGAPLDMGFGDEGSTMLQGSFWHGLAGFLVSPAKSVFLFCPPLILSLVLFRQFFRRAPVVATASLLVALSYLIGASAHSHWHGDWSWGPRHVLPAVLFCLLPIVTLLDGRPSRKRRLASVMATVLISVGVLVQLLVVSTHVARYFHENEEVRVNYHFARDVDRFYFSFDYVPLFSAASALPGVTSRTLDGIRNNYKDTISLTHSLIVELHACEDPVERASLDEQIRLLQRPSNLVLDYWWSRDLAFDRSQHWAPRVIPVFCCVMLGLSLLLLIRKSRLPSSSDRDRE